MAAEHPRIEELRRRVHRDPASIAFAQLAEEYRRAGRCKEAIETCRAGLSRHPGYLSARVTLGRALIETSQLDAAEAELKRVLAAAPENLAALRGLAEIHHRLGELPQALEHYRRALELAPHDPDLEHVVEQISQELEPVRRPPMVEGGLSFEEAVGEFLALGERAAPAAPAAAVPPGPPDVFPPDEADPASPPTQSAAASEVDVAPPEPSVFPPAPDASEAAPDEDSTQPVPAASGAAVDEPAVDHPAPAEEAARPGEERALAAPSAPGEAALQIATLERWLETILANRQSHV